MDNSRQGCKMAPNKTRILIFLNIFRSGNTLKCYAHLRVIEKPIAAFFRYISSGFFGNTVVHY